MRMHSDWAWNELGIIGGQLNSGCPITVRSESDQIGIEFRSDCSPIVTPVAAALAVAISIDFDQIPIKIRL